MGLEATFPALCSAYDTNYFPFLFLRRATTISHGWNVPSCGVRLFRESHVCGKGPGWRQAQPEKKEISNSPVITNALCY